MSEATPNLCYRTACRAPLEDGKTYWNLSTQRHYCEACAAKLNKINYDDAMKLYGGPLCVLDKRDACPPDQSPATSETQNPMQR